MILSADLGATKTVVALAELEAGRVALRFERRMADESFRDFESLLVAFLEEARASCGPFAIEAGCIGAAGPVQGNRVQLTNRQWLIDGDALAQRLRLARLAVVNDFAAAAVGIQSLREEDLVTLQRGIPEPRGARVVIGAGTGLGVAYAIAVAGDWQIIAGEGGHAGFAPQTEEQTRLVSHLRAAGRVSAETILSGAGLERVYRYVLHRSQCAPALQAAEGPAAITALALTQGDTLALEALDLFIACYGQVASDHALGVLARGGVYVTGGIAPKILPRLAAGGFIEAFNAKGEAARLTAQFPVHVVMNERIGVLGGAAIAARLMS